MNQLRRLRELTGYSLLAEDGMIGTLVKVYFDDQDWVVRYFVVRMGSWVFGREVLLAPATVRETVTDAHCLDVALSCRQIEGAPLADTHPPVSSHYEQQYERFVSPPPYRVATPDSGLFQPREPATEHLDAPVKPAHPHLRDSAELKGYHIHAQDGDIGHVEDFILEEPDWKIRFLEVATRNWLPGKHVLIAPMWILGVDWGFRQVTVDLSRESIRTAPPYDRTRTISPADQAALDTHYAKRPGAS